MADFLSEKYLVVMEMPAIEVFSMMVLIKHRDKINQLYTTNGNEA